MLKIRKEQIDALSHIKVKNFVAEVQAHLRQHFPKQVGALAAANQFDSWTKANVDQALKLEFKTEQEIIRYVNIAIIHGHEFYMLEWAQDILRQEIFPSTKISLLVMEAQHEISALQEKMDKISQRKDEATLAHFCKEKRGKLQTIGQHLFGLHFESPEKEQRWLQNVGATAMSFGLKDILEMDLWLDLTFQHGVDFYKQPWAQNQVNDTLSPSERLTAYLKNQPTSNQDSLTQGV